MKTIYTTLLRAPRDSNTDGTPSLEDIVFAHADKNYYGYPTNIRWQELFEDLKTRGRWKKPGKNNGRITIEAYESFGEVLLCDGTPAGLYLTWYHDTLQAVELFEIPENNYRDTLDKYVPLGTLTIPDGITMPMRNKDGTTTQVDLISIRRDTESGLLLVKTRWTDVETFEDFAHDLPVADIYQILQIMKR